MRSAFGPLAQTLPWVALILFCGTIAIIAAGEIGRAVRACRVRRLVVASAVALLAVVGGCVAFRSLAQLGSPSASSNPLSLAGLLAFASGERVPIAAAVAVGALVAATCWHGAGGRDVSAVAVPGEKPDKAAAIGALGEALVADCESGAIPRWGLSSCKVPGTRPRSMCWCALRTASSCWRQRLGLGWFQGPRTRRVGRGSGEAVGLTCCRTRCVRIWRTLLPLRTSWRMLLCGFADMLSTPEVRDSRQSWCPTSYRWMIWEASWAGTHGRQLAVIHPRIAPGGDCNVRRCGASLAAQRTLRVLDRIRGSRVEWDDLSARSADCVGLAVRCGPSSCGVPAASVQVQSAGL
jgi:hypothetical protein